MGRSPVRPYALDLSNESRLRRRAAEAITDDSSWSLLLIASRNWAWLMTIARAGVDVTTVAVAGPRSSMLISPKKSPA